VEPLGVFVDFDFCRRHVEDFAGLVEVGGGIFLDFLGVRTGGFSFCRWVADHGGGVADDEDGLVAEVLELAHFAEDDGVAEVEVGAVGSMPSLMRVVGPPPRWRGRRIRGVF